MKLRIALNDILVAPGTPLDSSPIPESEWVDRIRELYNAIVKVIDVAIVEGFADVEIPEVTFKHVSASLPTLSRGMDELIKGRYQKALALFQKVDTIFPGSTDARVNMARVYLKLNDPEKAARYLHECLLINPKDATAALMLGDIYRRIEKNPELAAFYYDKGLASAPDKADVLTGYAYFMMDKAEFQKAETYFRKAIHIEANPGAYYGLGLLLVKAGKLEDARQALEDLFTRTETNKGIQTYPVYHQVKEFYKDLSATMGLSKRSH